MNRRSPSFYLALSMLTLLIFLIILLAIGEKNPNSLALFGSSDWFVYFFFGGIIYLGAAGMFLRVYPNRLEVIRLFDITYFDNREDGGEFEVRYHDARPEFSKIEKVIIVKSIRNNPKKRLDITWKIQVPEGFPMDTKMVTTLDIKSKKGPIDLRLSFSSIEEMSRALPQFGTDGKESISSETL